MLKPGAEPALAISSGDGERSSPNYLYCTPRGGFFGVVSPNAEAWRKQTGNPYFSE